MFRNAAFCILALLLCQGGASIVFADEISLDLQKSIDLALSKNQQLLRARENIKKSRAQIKESSASAYPELKASADYTRIGNNDEVDFGGKSGTLVPDNNYKLDLNLSQKLYSPQVFEAIKASKSYARGIETELTIAEEEVVSSVKENYYNLLLSMELVNIQRESVKQLERQLEDVRRRLEFGFATDYDLLRAEVQLANAMPEFARAKNDIEVASSSLGLAIGLDPAVEIKVEGELLYRPYDVTLEEALATAVKKRPEVARADYNIETLERYTNVKKKEFSPTLKMHGNLSYANDDISIGESAEWDYSWNVGMTLDYSIFDGWERSSKLTQALIDVSNSRLEKSSLVNRISHEARTAYSSLAEAKELIRSQEKNVETAERAYEIARAGNANGVITQLELLDAQLALTSARVNHTKAVHSFLIAKTRLEKAMGTAFPEQGEAETGDTEEMR